MTVLAYVESSAYRVEVAKRLAQALVADVGLDGLLSGGSSLASDILGALGEDIGGLVRQAVDDTIKAAIARGLIEVPDAAAVAEAEQAVQKVLEAANGPLAAALDRLGASVDSMAAGTSEEAVAASLASAATTQALLAPIASILSSTAAGAIKAAESAVQTEAVATYQEAATADNPDAEPPLFEWQTVEDDKVCEDLMENSCRPRHGLQLTYDEWGAFGYPGDADSPTLCAIYAKGDFSNCRCVLIPAGSAAGSPTPINVADAIAAGRQRALGEAA